MNLDRLTEPEYVDQAVRHAHLLKLVAQERDGARDALAKTLNEKAAIAYDLRLLRGELDREQWPSKCEAQQRTVTVLNELLEKTTADVEQARCVAALYGKQRDEARQAMVDFQDRLKRRESDVVGLEGTLKRERKALSEMTHVADSWHASLKAAMVERDQARKDRDESKTDLNAAHDTLAAVRKERDEARRRLTISDKFHVLDICLGCGRSAGALCAACGGGTTGCNTMATPAANVPRSGSRSGLCSVNRCSECNYKENVCGCPCHLAMAKTPLSAEFHVLDRYLCPLCETALINHSPINHSIGLLHQDVSLCPRSGKRYAIPTIRLTEL